MLHRARRLFLGLAALAAATPALAQDYPARPVTIVVPFSAGGATDISARAIANLLTKQLGQPFVVENKVGASGMIGMASVAKAAPDGYTLFGTAANTIVWNTLLRKELPYDSVKELAPVAHLGGEAHAERPPVVSEKRVAVPDAP